MIATAINADNWTGFAEDAAGGLIATINAGNSTDCADLLISNDAADVLIKISAQSVEFPSLIAVINPPAAS